MASIQAASEFGKPERNRKVLKDLIEQAAHRGAQIVVLPETAVTGYMSDDLKQTWHVGDRPLTPGLTGTDPKDAAETVPGPSTRFFATIARRWGIYLTVPLLEADRKTGRYYNTLVLIGPDGGILIHYRKLNPWPWAERGWASEGNLGHPVVDTPFGRLGVLICFDIHKQAQELAKLKIDTLLYSIAWVDNKDSDWFPKRLPRIAAANGYNIIATNWTVSTARPEPSWHGYGQSTIVDASGRVLACADHVLQEGLHTRTTKESYWPNCLCPRPINRRAADDADEGRAQAEAAAQRIRCAASVGYPIQSLRDGKACRAPPAIRATTQSRPMR